MTDKETPPPPPPARGNGEENCTADVFAAYLPTVVLAPLALGLVCVQVAQLAAIRFSLAAEITTWLVIGAFAAALAIAGKRAAARTYRDRRLWLGVAALSAIFAVLAFILVRWNADDTHYLPNAVYFLAHPQTAMGFEAYYIHVDGPPFRALSWITSYAGEYLLAFFAHALGLEFLSMYWSGKTVVAAFLIPCAWYGMLRWFGIGPPTIFGAMFLTLLVVFVLGDTFEAYGQWFLTRLFHGKVILVSLGLPLIWTFTLRYLDAQGAKNLFPVFVCATAMMGLTTMSGFMIPATTGTLVLAYLIANRVNILQKVPALAALGAGFAYLFAATIYIRLNVNPVILENRNVVNRHYPGTYEGQISLVTDAAFPLSAIIVIVATFAALKYLSRPKSRVLAWWCGIYTVLFLTPLTAGWLMENLTTTNTYWRLFHGYPVPLVIGAAAAAFLAAASALKPVYKYSALGGALLVLAIPHLQLGAQIAFGWERTAPTIVRAVHRISLGGHRRFIERYRNVHEVLDAIPDGPVLAAHPVNSDIPIYSGRHPMIYARQIETEYWFLTRGDADRGLRRFAAMRFATGEAPEEVEKFFQVIGEEPNLKSLVLAPAAAALPGARKRIAEAGFADRGLAGGYRVFVRDGNGGNQPPAGG